MKNHIEWNDPLILQKLREKDRHIVSCFISNFQDSVFRVCMGFLHNKEDAEELTQDIFVDILNNIGQFRSECQLSTWMYRICYTRAVNRIRKHKRNSWLMMFDNLLGFEAVKDSSERPDIEFQSKETDKQIHEAIDHLPPLQRTAFILHHYEGLKYTEIAEVMNTSIASVESLIFRGKRNLQKKLRSLTKN